MNSYPFSMPSVHPAHIDVPSAGVWDRQSPDTEHGHRHVRVAVGGRVIEHELNQRELPADDAGRVSSR